MMKPLIVGSIKYGLSLLGVALLTFLAVRAYDAQRGAPLRFGQ